MGRVIAAHVAERSDCEVVAGIDLNTASNDGFPVYKCPSDCREEADVIIDFSHPSVLTGLLQYAVQRKLPAVIATTGLTKDQVAEIHEAGRHIPVFFTANMSLGVNLLVELAKKATCVLGGSFDIEIIEKHHNQKVDAPSGTALMIADSISECLNHKPKYTYDRHSQRKKRDRDEIGIHAVRGGTIAGEHEVMFAGEDEILTISHTATSKGIFANGSINAALFIVNKPPRVYNMGDMV